MRRTFVRQSPHGRWVALCPRCRWSAIAPTWRAAFRLAARHADADWLFEDDLRTYLAGGESIRTAAARRGITRESFITHIHRRGLGEYLDLLARNDPREWEARRVERTARGCPTRKW